MGGWRETAWLFLVVMGAVWGSTLGVALLAGLILMAIHG